MKYEEIIKLLDAGYTREEIISMEGPTPEDPTPEDPTPEDPTPETGMSDLVQEMRDAFSELKKEFTAFNIMSSRQPEEKTPEDIIATIINPSRKDK